MPELVAVMAGKVRMLFGIKLVPILARAGIIGIVLFSPWTVSRLMFGGPARCTHIHAMRFVIPDCSKICTVSLHQVVEVDVGVVEIEFVKVFGNFELNTFRSTLKRFHKSTEPDVHDSRTTAVHFALA